MYIVKAGTDPLWEIAHAAETAIKLMDGLGDSTPSDDFKSMATKIEMFVTRMVKFINQDRWRKIPALAPYEVVCMVKGSLGDNDVVLMTDGNGDIVYHEFATIADWLAARFDHGGAQTGQNFERLIRLLETIEDNRIMEAIKAKDRATAKRIVRKMEERAKQRALVKIVKTAKPLGAIGIHGGDRKSDQATKTENGHLKMGEHGPNTQVRRVSRIKRDHPELAARIMAGEFKSVSEAERAAGLRPPKATDLEKFQRAYFRLSIADQVSAKDWLKSL